MLQDNDVSVCFAVTTFSEKPSSKITREELEAQDLQLPTDFAKASKAAGCVRHMSMLSSASANVEAKPSWIAGTTSALTQGKARNHRVLV